MTPEIITLTVRRDGTYDYLYAEGYNDRVVIEYLRMVADEIEKGCAIPNPKGMP